jgi:catechol 2,3-dioxygenase-like lactoylglutathione lyase family enzyme
MELAAKCAATHRARGEHRKRASSPVSQAATGASMNVSAVIAQLRTTNLGESIRFYTTKLGFTLEFQYSDFYAGIRAGSQLFHLKLTDTRDLTVEIADREEHFHLYFMIDDTVAAAEALKRNGVALASGVHETVWGTREFVVKDDQGHTLYFGERLPATR